MGRACDGLKTVTPAWLAFARLRPSKKAADGERYSLAKVPKGGEGKGHGTPMLADDEDANGVWANTVRAGEDCTCE